jgi:hypothetical protein
MDLPPPMLRAFRVFFAVVILLTGAVAAAAFAVGAMIGIGWGVVTAVAGSALTSGVLVAFRSRVPILPAFLPSSRSRPAPRGDEPQPPTKQGSTHQHSG